MSATNPERAQRLADRWLRDHGNGLPLLDPPAHGLLGLRLVAQRRALVGMLAAAVVAIGGVTGLTYEALTRLRPDGVTPWSPAAGWYLLVAVTALPLGDLVMSAVLGRRERAFGALLPRRVTRSAPVRLADLAGRRAVVAVVVAAAACLGLVTVAWLAAPGAPAVFVTAACAIAAAGSAACVTRAVRRPAVAFDAVTLAVDERLRRAEIVLGAQLLVVAILLVNGMRPFVLTPGTPHAVGLAWFLAQVPVIGLQLSLVWPHTWPGPPYAHHASGPWAPPYPPRVAP